MGRTLVSSRGTWHNDMAHGIKYIHSLAYKSTISRDIVSADMELAGLLTLGPRLGVMMIQAALMIKLKRMHGAA